MLHLTKSRSMAGLACPRGLCSLAHEPPPYAEPVAGSQPDIGPDIGREAQLLFAGGVVITERPRRGHCSHGRRDGGWWRFGDFRACLPT